MGIFGDDLFDGKLATTFGMFSKPNQAKPSPAQQFYFLEAVRKPISKYFLFFLSKAETLVG